MELYTLLVAIGLIGREPIILVDNTKYPTLEECNQAADRRAEQAFTATVNLGFPVTGQVITKCIKKDDEQEDGADESGSNE